MKTFKEFISECELVEGKVEWDNPKRPGAKGLTPREANRAKRLSLGIEDPHRNSFVAGATEYDLTDKDYERYGKLKLAHDAEKDKKVPRDKRHKYGLFKVGSFTSTGPRGVVRRQNKDHRNLPIDSKLYMQGERQKIYHTNDLKEPK
jgi:hypothetical protein